MSAAHRRSAPRPKIDETHGQLSRLVRDWMGMAQDPRSDLGILEILETHRRPIALHPCLNDRELHFEHPWKTSRSISLQDYQVYSHTPRNFRSTIYHHHHRMCDKSISLYGTDPIIITSSHDTNKRYIVLQKDGTISIISQESFDGGSVDLHRLSST